MEAAGRYLYLVLPFTPLWHSSTVKISTGGSKDLFQPDSAFLMAAVLRVLVYITKVKQGGHGRMEDSTTSGLI